MRLFTGLPVSEAFIRAAGGVAEANTVLKGIRWVPAPNLHVTACFIGEQNQEKLSEISDRIREITRNTDRVTLDLDKITLWPLRKPYMVWALYEENEPFTSLYRRLEEVLLDQAGKGSVKPHVTLARFKPAADYKNLNLARQKIPERLEINHLVLFESKLASEGPTYYPLADFPFNASLRNP
jgi:2'-5' RNA ligase